MDKHFLYTPFSHFYERIFLYLLRFYECIFLLSLHFYEYLSLASKAEGTIQRSIKIFNIEENIRSPNRIFDSTIDVNMVDRMLYIKRNGC